MLIYRFGHNRYDCPKLADDMSSKFTPSEEASILFGRSQRKCKHLRLKTMNPSCSVVVIARNAERTISGCLYSLLNQTFKPTEIILVDNRSTDSTAKIAATFGVKIVYEPVVGRSKARNKGVRESKGELIAFIDADAVADVNWLAWLVRRYRQGGLVGVAGNIKALNPDKLAARLLELATANKPHYGGGNIMYERDVIMDVGMFNENLQMAEDVELAWRVLKAGKKIGFEPRAIVYHAHRESMSELLRQQYNFGKWSTKARKIHGMNFWKQRALLFAVPLLLVKNLPKVRLHPILPIFLAATSAAYGAGALVA
ncbi:MAG: glycosyltransferase [Nitrososphaerota archaeon]|nr:glycosyltransferase [Aigarchaeota archaeon]MDW8076189.1 glycosyltransferase [Nitrososphaerota archaeon]